MAERTIVVGGGLAGLAAAARLADAGADVELLEAADRVGGVVGSIARSGFLFERAPHTVLAGSATFRAVVDELGLSSRLEVASPGARTRWLWHSGRLRALPATPAALLATDLLSWRSKRRIASEALRTFHPLPDGAPEPTFGEFLDERLGAEAARLLAGAFVRGIHAAELDELGARSAFPRFWDLASRHGGIVRGVASRSFARQAPLPGPRLPRGALVAFPNGLQELVDAFAARLGTRVRTRASAVGLERIGSRWLVRTYDGRGRVADHVIVAGPARVAARLLEPALAGDDLARVAAIRHASVAVVSLGFAAGALEALPEGFGYLVPPTEEGRHAPAPTALGTIFVTNLFPHRAPRGARSVASFYRAADVVQHDDAALARMAERDLGLAIGATVPRATVAHIERWSDVIPRHAPGHFGLISRVRGALRERARGLHAAGAWVDGVSVEQVLTSGRAAADEVLKVREEMP